MGGMLPKPPDTISVEALLVRHQDHVVEHGLRYQQPVERIFVWARQRASRLAVPKADRQVKEILARDDTRKVGKRLPRLQAICRR
jgi:hypothetical protein